MFLSGAALEGGKAITTQTNTPYGKQSLDRWPFIKRFGFLRNEAMTWYPAWKELAQFVNPTRGFFMDDIPNRGKKIDHKVVMDGHARRAVRTLASGMTSGLTSPSRPWFRIGVPDPDLSENTNVKIWCDDVQNRMLDVFARSNIYGALYSAYEEIATFGTAALFLAADFNEVIRARSFTIGEYFLGCGPNGRVNAFARQYWMTALQLVEEFGIENVSPQVQQKYENHNTESWIKVNFLIEVNDDRIPGIKDFRNMPYRSLYWEDGSMQDTYLRVGGFEDFPILAPRWDTTTTADSYGRGPGWDALGDVKMLQKMQYQALTALDKVIDPPTQQDSSIQGDANTLPGGVTRYSALAPNAGVRPAYQIQPDIAAMEAKIERTEKKIDAAFYSDLFLMLIQGDTGNMTATEVAERQSEKLQMLGPVLERLENELLNPLIDRTFSIMLSKGLIPPAPREIQGATLKAQYISILAQAQKMVGVTAMQQQLGIVGNMMQASPEVGDIIDWDEAGRESAEMLAVPAKMIKSPEAVAAIRKARADAQAKQQQMQMALASTQAAKNGAGAAKDLGNTPVGKNSALDATLAGLTGAQP